jgi:putative ABC transport system ATP-binding protein
VTEQTPDDAQDRPPPSPSDLPEFFWVLERWLREVGGELDLSTARAAAERGRWGRPSDSYLDQLARAGEAIGLRVVVGSGTVRELLAAVRPESAVAVVVAGSTGDALALVTDSTPARALLQRGSPDAEGTWCGLGELATLLGVEGPQSTVSWAVSMPVAPCDSAAAPDRRVTRGSQVAPRDHDAEPDHERHAAGQGGHGARRPTPFRRLLGLLRPESSDILIVCVFAFGVGVLSLGTPIAVEALVNNVAFTNARPQVLVLALLLLVCLVFSNSLLAMQTYVVELIQRRIFLRVFADLTHRLPRARIEAFDHEHGPELVNRFFEVLTVQKVGASLLLEGFAIVLATVIGMIVLALYHPYLLGFDVILLASICFGLFVLGRRAVRTSIEESLAKYAVAEWLEEMARHPIAFRLVGGSAYALQRADLLATRYIQTRRSHFRILFRQVVFLLGLQALASTVLLGLGGWLVVQGQLNLGQLVAAELIVSMIVASFAKLGKLLDGFYDLMAAMDKLGHLIDLPLERRGGQVHAPREPAARLTLRRVSFSYDGHRDVLHNFNLDVAPGEIVALVGGEASGKSTLAELLYGLRAPIAGRIELDGVDLRDLRLIDLREHVALVSTPEVFVGSIEENVRLGRMSKSAEDVREALDAVALRDEIAELHQGMRTRLQTGGSPLSQGQIRRLVLARALAGSPRLLILDETLDPMDGALREHVLAYLRKAAPRVTVLALTRDPEIGRLCDRIVAAPESAVGHAEQAPAVSTGDKTTRN